MSNCLTIAGIQWGDEGKGKVTDLLAARAQVVVRYQGGANAGHTVVVDGRKVVLHQVPSGALNPGATCVIGPFVVVDPETLLAEVEELGRSGISIGPDRLLISRAAHAVLPVHKALDAAREKSRGAGKIGTTGRGIGPAYEDIASSSGVRMSDLCDPVRLRERLEVLLGERGALLRHFGAPVPTLDSLVETCSGWGRRLGPWLADTGLAVHQAMTAGHRVLFESAQGTLLDVLHGTFPFVTSSLTTAPAAFALSGVGIARDGVVVGVMKAYTTRVGAGPFPTEDHGERGAFLRDHGGEYGATSGRPRRCGFLDLPSLRYAVRVNGVSSLSIMKLDVLSGWARIPVCVAYRGADGTVTGDIHPDRFMEPGLTPVYEEWDGWSEDLSSIRDVASLPEATREYVRRIEAALGVPASVLSVGSGRESTAFLQDPWA